MAGESRKEEDFNSILNKGKDPVSVTIKALPFYAVIGSIPHIVPLMRQEGREFASANQVFKERLEAMISNDEQKISVWCRSYFDLSDACITFEDMVKVQPNSHLLRGIVGVVKTCDGEYIAVSADSVYKASNGNLGFQLRQKETVLYGDNMQRQVNDVVLFRYADSHIEMDADQFRDLVGKPIKKDSFCHDEEMEIKQILQGGKVIHPVYKRLVPEQNMRRFAEYTFKFLRKDSNKRRGMGLYLDEEPAANAYLTNFCIDSIGNQSRILGYSVIGKPDGKMIGAVTKKLLRKMTGPRPYSI